MDFHALPRRDLQALCKRNGVRANMTNAAMADALGALSTVDGVEEYDKQQTAVPEPASKGAVAEEVRREKQGSPLPRGRRVTAKTSEVVKPEQGKGEEEENADAKRESNREEDAAGLGAGRRGPGRRARPTPAVAVPEPRAGAEKKGSPPPRARREPARPDDAVEKVDLKREASKEDAPIHGAVRRGPSRRARAAAVVAASTAEPQTKVAAEEEEEKQGSSLPHRITSKPPEPARPEDSFEETEDMKLVTNDDDAPVQGVGRCGPTLRARPAPAVSKPTAKAVVGELGSPLPRDRRVAVEVKSSAAVSTEGGEKDKNEDMQREASEENVRTPGVGRRGASRRAQPEPAVSAPVDEAPAEKDAPEPIMPNGGEEVDKEELKLEEKEEDAPAHCVVRRGPSRRTLPAPLEARATRRRDVASSSEERDVPLEAVLVRPTRVSRVRKPIMKAAAAREEKVPRRTTKNAAPRNSTLQNEKQQEERQEAVPAPLSEEACHDLENVEEAADPQNLEQNVVIDESRQGGEEVVMNEDEILMDETPAEKPPLANEILMEETLADEPPAICEECTSNPEVEELECKDKPPLEEEQVEVEHCSSPLPCQEDSPIPGLVSTFDEQTVEKDEDPTLQNEKQQEERQEVVPASLCEEACHDLENVEETADPQNLEQNVVIDESRQGGEEIVMNEDEILMDETPAEKPPLANEILMEETLADEPPAICGECTGNLEVEELECKDKQPLEEEQVEVEHCSSPLLCQEDSPISGLVSTFDEQTVEKDEDSTLQNEKQQEERQEAVPASLSEEACHDLENVEEAADPQNLEQNVVIDESRKGGEEVVMNKDEILMDETPAEKPSLANEILMEETLADEPPTICEECTGNPEVEELECKDKPPLEEEQVEVEHCSSPLPCQEDSPIPGLVSTFDEQTIEKDEDEDARFQEGSGPSEGRLDKDMDEEIHDAGKEAEMVPVIQRPLTAAKPAADVGLTDHTDHGSEMEGSNSLQGTEDTRKTDAEDGLVWQEKGDVADDDVEAHSNMVDEAVVLDYSENISLVVEKKAVETMDSELVHNEVVISNNVFQVTLINGEGARVEKAELVTEELTQGSAQSDADVEVDYFQTDSVHVDGLKELVGMEKERVAEELLPGMATMYEDVEEDSFQNDFTRVDERNLVADVDMEELVTDKLPQSKATMDKDVEEDGFQSVRVDEQKLVDVEKAQRVTDKLPQSTTTMDEDVEGDFQTDFVHVKEQKGKTAADLAQEDTINGDIVVEKVLVTKEMQQNLTEMDDDKLKTDFILADQQKGVATADKEPKLTGIDGEIDEEKVVEITEEIPQSIGIMNKCGHEGYFDIDVYADELTKVVTADNVLEVTETEDEDVRKEKNDFTGDLTSELDVATDYSYHITSSLIDDISESLSKITITESTVSKNEDLPLCKNSSEKNTAEPVCKNSSEKNTDEPLRENKSEKTTAEPVAMQENKGVKVSKKSADLYGLSNRQLRAKVKKTLERMEAKRVALARVDENACRSNATGQKQVRKLQQY